MANKPDKSKLESLGTRALQLINRRYEIEQLVLVDRGEDERPSKQKIHQFRAVAEIDANGPQYSIVLDENGHEIDLAQIQEQDQREYFALLDLDMDALEHARLVPRASITIQPTINDIVLKQGDSSNETISVIVPPNATVPKVDVYLLADTTGSMGPVIDAVKVGAGNIMATLQVLGLDFAFGVGNYKDFPNDPHAFQHQLSPSNVTGDIQTAINTWSANGGGDWPEGQLFALNRLAEPAGGTIGWRPEARRIIVWFGDAPGHDPICAAISGESAGITGTSVTAKLVNEKINVLAISTANPGLDGDPKTGTDYVSSCGPPGGTPGQGTEIAKATGGIFVTGVNAGNISQTIINRVKETVGGLKNLSLVPTGNSAPFVTSITPAGGYGSLADNETHVLKFEVEFAGVVPCKAGDTVFNGTIDVVADGAVVTQKRVRIIVPSCEPEYHYSVKFLCGVAQECDCECTSVRPGGYATEISIYNPWNTEAKILKRFIPVIMAGAARGRAPKVVSAQAEETITLLHRMATMDDCCSIAEKVYGAVPNVQLPLTVGFLEIISPVELHVTAVYTVSDPDAGSISIDVETIEAKRSR